MDTTPNTFHSDVFQSPLPVLVDFWADWCAPCRVLGPQIDRIAAEHQTTLRVVKFDAGQFVDFTSQYGISSLPTLIVFVGGKEVARKVGAAGGYAAVLKLIQPFLQDAA